MDEEEMEVGLEGSSVINIDMENTVGYGLISEAEKLHQITPEEADFLRRNFKKLSEQLESSKNQDAYLSRRISIVQSDILAEKISLEKAKEEEEEETERVKRAGERRSQLQRELEEVEQQETMVKFELYELKRVHEELQRSLENMKEENSQLVEPILEKLKTETAVLTEQLNQTEEAYTRECNQKLIIENKLVEIKKLLEEKKNLLALKQEALKGAQAEPARLERQIQSIQSANDMMNKDLTVLEKKLQKSKEDNEKFIQKKKSLEKDRQDILQSAEMVHQKLEERRRDSDEVSQTLAKEKSITHDLVAKKKQLIESKKDVDSELKSVNNHLVIAKKEYETLTRQLKKKQVIIDLARQNIPGLESQLKDQQSILYNMENDRSSKKRQLEKYKDELDQIIVRLLSHEDVEKEKKEELEKVLSEVESLEEKVVESLAESKRQSKLLAVLSAQRDIKSRENSRIESKERDAKHQVKVKQLTILDLTKRCNEISNRLKEFSALYEVVKNERNKYVNLIQSSAQAVAEMREKIRILHNEVEILSNERAAKDMALTKEDNAHQQAQNQRDALRQDLNRLLSEYRHRQSNVEQQIQEIDKLNTVIRSLEKEIESLKVQYEKSAEMRNTTHQQLIERNDELCMLYERSNTQQDVLRKGELSIVKKQEEVRILKISLDELKRKYVIAQSKLPKIEEMKQTYQTYQTKIEEERKAIEEFSKKLEDPSNLERWRPLEGEDPDLEQLLAKIQVLEDRLNKKRESLIEKELVLEEITSLTEKLKNQASMKKDSAKLLADELNDLHGKIRGVTKKMLSNVSELSMYQATSLRLQQEKLQREKYLEQVKWAVKNDKVPSPEAELQLQRAIRSLILREESEERKSQEVVYDPDNPQFLRTAAEPRPTAYIPDDLGIPKPYGSLAPFKPTENGSTMRHIKPPKIKPIEI